MKQKFLILHCTATPEGREVSSVEIRQWHMGPAVQQDKTVKYLGKSYDAISALPPDKIGGIPVYKLQGRGWSQVGYSDMIHLNGWIENLVPHNDDAEIDQWEITNGVAGVNSVSRHVVYSGGKTHDNATDKDTRTEAQLKAMLDYVKAAIAHNPDVLIAGHNQFDVKACPSFEVAKWLRANKIDKKNIYQAPLKVKPAETQDASLDQKPE